MQHRKRRQIWSMKRQNNTTRPKRYPTNKQNLAEFLGACFYWCIIAIHYHFKRKKEGHRKLKVPSLSEIMDMPTGDKNKDIQYVDGCLLYCIGMVLIIPFVLLIAYIFYLICASFK